MHKKTLCGLVLGAGLLLAVSVWILGSRNQGFGPSMTDGEMRSVVASMNLDERPLSITDLESILLRLDGWDRVVFCAPYRDGHEFLEAGIRDASLARELASTSQSVEAWRLFALSEDHRITAKASVHLADDEKPDEAVVVFTRSK